MGGHSRRERKIGARIEWRIDVDQVHLAGEFRQEGRQDVFLVTPDQQVAPLLFSESRAIPQTTLTVLCRLIHRLNRLKRERYPQGRHAPTGGVVFPIPDQFRAGGSALRVRRCIAPRRILRRRRRGVERAATRIPPVAATPTPALEHGGRMAGDERR